MFETYTKAGEFSLLVLKELDKLFTLFSADVVDLQTVGHVTWKETIVNQEINQKTTNPRSSRISVVASNTIQERNGSSK